MPQMIFFVTLPNFNPLFSGSAKRQNEMGSRGFVIGGTPARVHPPFLRATQQLPACPPPPLVGSAGVGASLVKLGWTEKIFAQNVNYFEKGAKIRKFFHGHF